MGRRLVLALLSVALAGCADVIAGSDGFADELETNGIAGEPVRDAACIRGVRGWTYVCTYVVGTGRKRTAFLVDERDNVLATFHGDAGLPVAPGPAQVRRWSTFIASATSICAERNAVLRTLPSAKSRPEALRNVARAAAAEQLVVGQLGALEPPASLAADHSRLLLAERTLLRATEKWLAARRRGNVFALTRATNAAAIAGRDVTFSARRLGLQNCSHS